MYKRQILGIQIIDINSINSLPILEDLNSINIVIGIIAIPTCILYYYMYRNNEFFILTLSYVSILIEYIYVNFINSYNVLIQHLITFTFVFRVFLLTIAIFNEGKYANKILKNKRISIILAMIINFVVTFIEVKFNVNYILISNNKILWNILQGSILIYYFILLILLSIRCIRKNKFIYTIFITTISIFTIRRIFYFDIFFKYSDKMCIRDRSGSYIDFKMLSNKEKLNRIFQATINITMRNINNINNVQKKATRKQIIEFLNNDIKEEDFNRFIDELLPFANNFIENIDQLTEDKNILETIKFAQVLMGDNVGAFIMGTEIRVYFDIYFTTVFSYYLGLLAPTYLGTFLIEEIICGLKESNDFFEKAANVFNDEIGHNLTKLGLEPVSYTHLDVYKRQL